MSPQSTYLSPEKLAELRRHIQTAVQIELSTIPVYLYTFYSINRQPSWGDDGKKGGPGDQLATFANRAGGIIMSVAVEEMLHMSLAANILRSIGGTPKFYGQSPTPFPTNLPHHNKMTTDPNGHLVPMSVGLQALSIDQLGVFLEIELPEAPGAEPESDNWKTLGQFYDYISRKIALVDPEVFAGNAETQLQSASGYYTANTVDTIYPNDAYWVKSIKPDNPNPAGFTASQANFTNNLDSGLMQVICNVSDALAAMTTIKHQGEGYAVNDATHQFDDKQQDETSHWFKFNQLRETILTDPVVGEHLGYALFPAFVNNPTRAAWSDQTGGKSDIVIDLVNAVYAYLLLLTEVSFTLTGPAQHTLFFIGMHKGMIFILDKLIGNMRWPYSASGSGTQDFPIGLSPTFEFYPFESNQTALRELVALAAKVNQQYPKICDDNIFGRIQVLPDIQVEAGQPIRFGV